MIYTVGTVSAAAAAGAPYAEIRSGAAKPMRLREVAVFLRAATSSEVGLARATAIGLVPVTALGQGVDPAEAAGTGGVAASWGTAPTFVGTDYLDRVLMPATLGAGFVWRFAPGEEIVVPVSESLLLWNTGAGAGAALTVRAKWDE